MTPAEVSQNLNKIANYIDASGTPERAKVLGGLKRILSGLKVAADVKKFTQKEFDGAIQGIDALIARMQKVVKTMNEQDPASADLSEAVNTFMRSKQMILKEFAGLDAQV